MTEMRRFATFELNGTPTWGELRGGKLYDLGPSGSGVAEDLRTAIANDVLSSSLEDGLDGIDPKDVEFLPVIPNPEKIICIGVNYHDHAAEAGKETPTAPTVFTRFADSQMGHGRDAIRPATTNKFDYEGELALVIGRDAYHISEENAWDVVAGYAPYNDFSVRDWQLAATQWTPGKNFVATGGFGPYFVPRSAVVDLDSTQLTTKVNGEIRQQAQLKDLVFSIPRIIAYVTGFTPLSAGDVIVTGTPGGVGLFMTPPGMLIDGDIVEVDITGIGTLVNTVRQAS